MEENYRIQVQGRLDPHWSDWLDGMAVHHRDDGTTELVGPIVDQAALHGVIARIRDLGLSLISISRAEPEQHDVSTDPIR